MIKQMLFFPLWLPHLVCYLCSENRKVIDIDTVVWSTYRPGLLGKRSPSRLVWLLMKQKDFRTQFYHRIGKPRVFLRCLLPGLNDCSFEGCQIGEGWVLLHGYGTVVNGWAKIGKNCTMYHHVTIGIASDIHGVPTIGDNVIIGAGAKILGKIKIGNHVKIGAGAVVVNDIPDNSTVVGPKAQIICRNSN